MWWLLLLIPGVFIIAYTIAAMVGVKWADRVMRQQWLDLVTKRGVIDDHQDDD